MALDAEDLAQIKEMLTEAMQASAPQGATQEPIAPAAAPSAPPTTPAPVDFEAMLQNAVKTITQRQDSDLTQQLWQDKLQAMPEEFRSYLETEDEYGDKRIEKIEKVEQFGDRAKLLQNLAQRYNEAQVNATQSGQQPVIPKKVQEAADKSNKAYADLDAKLLAGEITPEQHTEGLFDNLDLEGLV